MDWQTVVVNTSESNFSFGIDQKLLCFIVLLFFSTALSKCISQFAGQNCFIAPVRKTSFVHQQPLT